jgi:hypothetical protein
MESPLYSTELYIDPHQFVTDTDGCCWVLVQVPVRVLSSLIENSQHLLLLRPVESLLNFEDDKEISSSCV